MLFLFVLAGCGSDAPDALAVQERMQKEAMEALAKINESPNGLWPTQLAGWSDSPDMLYFGDRVPSTPPEVVVAVYKGRMVPDGYMVCYNHGGVNYVERRDIRRVLELDSAKRRENKLPPLPIGLGTLE